MKLMMPGFEKEAKDGGIIYRVNISIVIDVDKTPDSEEDRPLELLTYQELLRFLRKVLWWVIPSSN